MTEQDEPVGRAIHEITRLADGRRVLVVATRERGGWLYSWWWHPEDGFGDKARWADGHSEVPFATKEEAQQAAIADAGG